MASPKFLSVGKWIYSRCVGVKIATPKFLSFGKWIYSRCVAVKMASPRLLHYFVSRKCYRNIGESVEQK